MKKYYSIIIISIIITSCSYFEKSHIELNDDTSTKTTNYTITVNQALNNLYSFCGLSDVKSSENCYQIENIFVICNDSPKTKSLNVDTMLYVVNFKNDQGYAVLSADNRIKEDVILISENGNVTPSQFNNEVAKINDSIIRYTNPRSENCIIGGSPANAENFILEQSVHYAESILENGGYNDKDENVGAFNDYDSWVVPVNRIRWNDTIVNTLMRTRWHQNSPYNNNVPRGKAAGCVPIALAQIMAYNGFPPLEISGTEIDWQILAIRQNVIPNTTAALMAAKLIRHIQVHCDSWILVNGTFTFPKKAEEFLRNIGYNNVKRTTGYDESLILTSLRNNYPVFLAGAQNYIIFKSHGWVVDGWFKLMEQYDLQDKNTGKIVSSKTETVCNYLHCNWGNDNSSWVVSGVFNTGSSTYNTWYRMITYTL